jgi:hypothetical protein
MHNKELAVEGNVNVGKVVFNPRDVLIQEQQPSGAG